MCKAIADMRADERNAGRAEGRIEGRAEGKIEGRIEGKAEGRIESRIEDILTLLDELRGKVSKELREIIASEKDAETLKRYLKLAASVDSVEEFMNRMA